MGWDSWLPKAKAVGVAAVSLATAVAGVPWLIKTKTPPWPLPGLLPSTIRSVSPSPLTSLGEDLIALA